MLSAGLLFAFAVVAAASEWFLKPRREGVASPIGVLTDRVMAGTTVIALVGPLLLEALLPSGLSATTSSLVVVAGVFMALGGISLRAWSMVRLGRRFQLTPMSIPGQPCVVSSGPYAVVRHPGYAGLVTAFVGASFFFGQPLSVLFVLPMAFGSLGRIRFEEISLISELGETYAMYRRSVKWRLIPKIY